MLQPHAPSVNPGTVASVGGDSCHSKDPVGLMSGSDDVGLISGSKTRWWGRNRCGRSRRLARLFVKLSEAEVIESHPFKEP